MPARQLWRRRWDRRIRHFSLDSQLAVASLGLGTGSRIGLLADHRSAIRIPHARREGGMLVSASSRTHQRGGWDDVRTYARLKQLVRKVYEFFRDTADAPDIPDIRSLSREPNAAG